MTVDPPAGSPIGTVDNFNKTREAYCCLTEQIGGGQNFAVFLPGLEFPKDPPVLKALPAIPSLIPRDHRIPEIHLAEQGLKPGMLA